MPKLRMPEDRQTIHWLIFDRMLGFDTAGQPLIIPKQGDPRLVSHQLGLQGMVEDPSVRMGVNELIGVGKIVTSEPEWVDEQNEDPTLASRVLHGRLVA